MQQILHDDILPSINPTLDGMAWGSSWTYNGGFGLAGAHYEDGWLHYGHHMIDIRFSGSQPYQSLLETVATYSRKTWLIFQQDPLKMNKLIADMWRNPSYADEHLVSRVYVLDPRKFGTQPGFQLLYQKPGEMLFGDNGHCVFGSGLFSFACNFAMQDSLHKYMKAEIDMANVIRPVSEEYLQMRATFNNGIEPILRDFVLGCAIAYGYISTCLKQGANRFAKLLRDYLNMIYTIDKSGSVAGEILREDAEAVPVNAADMQCERCGISCVYAKYVIQPEGTGVCGQCIQYLGLPKSQYKVVSCINTFLAKMIGL
jgi:hypothetical protein